jgi:predicted  nucleic acid-binding Zn-ribbon protein
LKQKAKFEKQMFEQKKNSEMEYNELQAEKFEAEVRKKELQKKLEYKDKEIGQLKEKYSVLSEKLQEREEMLQEKEWLLVEIRQEFEEKFLELQNNHAKERDELMAMLRTKRTDVKHFLLIFFHWAKLVVLFFEYTRSQIEIFFFWYNYQLSIYKGKSFNN